MEFREIGTKMVFLMLRVSHLKLQKVPGSDDSGNVTHRILAQL